MGEDAPGQVCRAASPYTPTLGRTVNVSVIGNGKRINIKLGVVDLGCVPRRYIGKRGIFYNRVAFLRLRAGRELSTGQTLLSFRQICTFRVIL